MLSDCLATWHLRVFMHTFEYNCVFGCRLRAPHFMIRRLTSVLVGFKSLSMSSGAMLKTYEKNYGQMAYTNSVEFQNERTKKTTTTPENIVSAFLARNIFHGANSTVGLKTFDSYTLMRYSNE